MAAAGIASRSTHGPPAEEKSPQLFSADDEKLQQISARNSP
jgi:hypothetical protein